MKKPLFLLTLLLCCCLVGFSQDAKKGLEGSVPEGMKIDKALYSLLSEGNSDFTTNKPSKNGPVRITEEENPFSMTGQMIFDKEGRV